MNNSKKSKLNKFTQSSDFRLSRAAGPIEAKITGVISFAVSALLGAFLMFLIVAAYKSHKYFPTGLDLAIGLIALITAFFLYVAIRLLIYGNEKQANIFSPKIWLFFGASALIFGIIAAVILLTEGHLKRALSGIFAFGMIAFACFAVARVIANQTRNRR